MGLLDFFSRKNSRENDSIKRDIAEMKTNIANLREKVRVSDKNIETLYEAIGELLKDIEKISGNMPVKSGTEDLEKVPKEDIIRLKSDLSGIEAGMLEMKGKISEIMNVSRLAIQNHDEIKEITRQLHSINKDAPEGEKNTEINRNAELSSKESRVLNALLNSEIPLTYEEIAIQVNISPITVKGYINSIKKANPGIILENTKGRGRKAYTIKSEYKLKVLSGK